LNTQGYQVGTEHPTAVDPGEHLAEAIRRDIEQAREADELAREHRRRAGRKLVQLRGLRGREWLQGLSLDETTAALLVELAVGSRPASF
jgi:hypothetical protein